MQMSCAITRVLPVLLLLLLSAGPADSSDLVVGQAWFEDRTGQMTLDQVRAQPLTPFEGSLSSGFGDGTIWVRLQVDPARADADAIGSEFLILRVLSALFLEVQLHDPLWPAGPLTTGLVSDPGVEFVASRYPTFALPRGDAPRDVWLKLSSHHARFARIEVLSMGDWVERKTDEARWATAYFTLMLGLLTATLFSYWFQRDPLLLVFSGFQLAYLGQSMVLLGELRVLLAYTPLIPLADFLIDAIMFGTVALMFTVFYLLLKEHRPPAWLMRLLLGCVALTILLWLWALAGDAHQAFLLYNYLIVPGCAVALYASLVARPSVGADAPVLPVHWLSGVFSIFFLTVLMNMLNLLGVTSQAVTGRYFTIANGPLAAWLLLGYLYVRRRRTEQLRARATAELAAALRGREEREELLAMLAHEIKTPLSTLKIAASGGTGSVGTTSKAIEDIEGILERCVQLGLLESEHIAPQWVPCELGEVLAQVAESLPEERPLDWSEAESHSLVTDPRLLHVILRNLLFNAHKYSPPGGIVKIASGRLSRDGRSGVEIRVTNEPGEAGWPDPDRVFRKYYRSTGARRGSGSGLGLYLVAGLARMLGGAAEYRPTSSQVQFVVWLPEARDGAQP